jgi:hypothetical protein
MYMHWVRLFNCNIMMMMLAHQATFMALVASTFTVDSVHTGPEDKLWP